MRPTSPRGILGMINKKINNGKPVPPWMTEALDQAIREKPEQHQKALAEIIEKQSLKERPWLKPGSARLKGLPGGKYGPASKGGSLTPKEMAIRAKELELEGVTSRKAGASSPVTPRQASPSL